MKKLKFLKLFNEKYEHSSISDIIDRFNTINKERNLLNTQIREYYTPLLTDAAKNKDIAEYNRLINELPDCPFRITAHRIGELNGL